LASGYLGLAAGTPINYRDHPPLAEMWAALPLLRLPLSTLRQSAQWGRLYNYSDAFLYFNTLPADRILNQARRWCLASWMLLLLFGVLSWAAEGGTASLAAAAALSAFCTPLFSNAALVTTDMAAAVFYFWTFRLCARAPRTRTVCVLAGVCLGAALASKFNMLVLPAFLACALLTDARLSKKPALKASDAGLLAAAALLTLAAIYRFTGLPLYWQGLTETIERLGQGRSSFLHGAHSVTGTALYFPAALLVKTPLPLLAASALGLALWARSFDAAGFWLVFPPAALFILACSSKTQIGYRHILPVYPFLILLGARGAAWAWSRSRGGQAACLLAAAWLAAGAVRVHPDHLAYFNELAGGPDGGYHWLVDSNLDWGQGLKELGAELKRRGGPPVYLSYFGVADPSYYGIRYAPFGWVTNVDRRDGAAEPGPRDPVLLAVSATNLQGVYFQNKEAFAWLKERAPVFVAGHSIFLYDLTADADGRARLAALAAGAGASSGALRRLALQ
jgi:hypothetical protein